MGLRSRIMRRINFAHDDNKFLAPHRDDRLEAASSLSRATTETLPLSLVRKYPVLIVKRLSPISLYAYHARVSMRYDLRARLTWGPVVTALSSLLEDPSQAGRKREREKTGRSTSTTTTPGEQGGRVLTRALRAVLSWSARTRVMSPCLFDPLSRILMMVQMSRRTGAILSRSLGRMRGRPRLRRPRGDEPPFLAATPTTSFLLYSRASPPRGWNFGLCLTAKRFPFSRGGDDDGPRWWRNAKKFGRTRTSGMQRRFLRGSFMLPANSRDLSLLRGRIGRHIGAISRDNPRRARRLAFQGKTSEF